MKAKTGLTPFLLLAVAGCASSSSKVPPQFVQTGPPVPPSYVIKALNCTGSGVKMSAVKVTLPVGQSQGTFDVPVILDGVTYFSVTKEFSFRVGNNLEAQGVSFAADARPPEVGSIYIIPKTKTTSLTGTDIAAKMTYNGPDRETTKPTQLNIEALCDYEITPNSR